VWQHRKIVSQYVIHFVDQLYSWYHLVKHDLLKWTHRINNQIEFIPLIGTIVKHFTGITAPLAFLEFTNGSHFKTLFALLDSGAQLNVIDLALLKTLQYNRPQIEPQCPLLRGVQGHVTNIIKWISLPITLSNGQNESVTLAVVDGLPNGIIFGRPFLLQVRALVDHYNKTMTTAGGPIRLVESKTSVSVASALIVTVADINCPAITDSDAAKVVALLNEFPSLWAGERRGLCSRTSHKIQLRHSSPINCRPRRHSPEQQTAIEAEVNEMLKDNVIQPSSSPYASEIVMSKKKSGAWRVCIDYRRLNEITVPDRYPLPRIPDLLYRIQRSRFFVALDLRAGYWQIPVDDESIPYTAFRCFKGLYEFCVMPFGLINAPATFQRLMNELFGDLYFDGVVVYMDDILIHADTVSAALERLNKVLSRLDSAGLTLNLAKCEFFPLEVEYLGHVIRDGHITAKPSKVSALRQIRTPKTAYDVRRVLGMIGYYQQFVKNYSAILAPIFDLLKTTRNCKRSNQTTEVEWRDEHQVALDTAIDRLAETVLQIPIESDEFLVETDASDAAVGAILSCRQQSGDWTPVEFASKKFSATQQRWPTREKEAFAIVFATQKFEHYLRGRSFTVHTDHQSLKWMLEARVGKIARWASRMTEFDMTVVYRKGQEMMHVDFLSRFIDNDQDINLQDRMVYNIVTTDLPTIEEVVLEQQEQPHPVGKGYFFRDNRWYFRNGLWVPPRLRTTIIRACHSLAPLRHPGVKKTKALVNKVFCWPNMHEDITKHIKACLVCQQSRPGLDRLQGLFRTHPIPGPFQTVYMDYWSCEYQGTRTVLTMIDQFTKWAECVPIPDKTENTVISAFVKSWICRFGVPQRIITDNDKTFMSALFQRISQQLGISALRTTVYHPEGNAPIEAFHKTLRKGLMHFTARPNLAFDEALQLVLMSYRCTAHSTTSESPGFLTYGVDLRSPLPNDWRFCKNTDEKERLRYINEMRLDVQFQAVKSIAMRNQKRNEKRIDQIFQLHDLVLTRLTPLEISRLAYERGGRKLVPRWSLPCRVVQVNNGGKTAVVKSLLCGRLKEAHIQDARFIQAPQDPDQRREWEELLLNPESTTFDSSTRERVLREFWEKVENPVATADFENAGARKRRREAFVGSSGGGCGAICTPRGNSLIDPPNDSPPQS
jgi:transposase InsO family protein